MTALHRIAYRATSAARKQCSISCSRRYYIKPIVKGTVWNSLPPPTEPNSNQGNQEAQPILAGPLQSDRRLKLDRGAYIAFNDIIGKGIRDVVPTSKQAIQYRIHEPSLAEYATLSPRLVTPIYPQDASLIVSLLDLHPTVPGNTSEPCEEKLEIFEAGTGHGALTLYLARAIHGANTAAPPIPLVPTSSTAPNDEPTDITSLADEIQDNQFNLEISATQEEYDAWRSRRRAVLHTLDISKRHSKHAEKTVRNFRNGMYFPNIDFHVGTITDYLSDRLSKSEGPFLSHAILDLPGTHDYLDIIGEALRPNGSLITFCPSVTQIYKCTAAVKAHRLPFVLETVLELGGGIGVGGREWDVRAVKPRSLLKAEAQAREQMAGEEEMGQDKAGEQTDLEVPPESDSGYEMICRPKRRITRDSSGAQSILQDIVKQKSTCYLKMTRRIVRTMCQLGALTVVALIVLFFVDNKFRVLPSAIHTYMPAHHPGAIITDITVVMCSGLNIFSSCKLTGNGWQRVEKDLYLGTSLFSSAYVHVQRKKEQDLTDDDKVIVDVTVGRLDPSATGKEQEGENWESRSSGIWLKRSKKRHASDSDEAVTAIDVLFGADAVDPREGWKIAGTPLLLNTAGEAQEARLSVKQGTKVTVPKPQPRINEHGKFKIMQVADIHLSTGTGRCRDAMPEGEPCEADPRTLEFIGRLLDEEKPDLVVLSGDQVNGETAADAQSAIFKYAELFIKRNIPYASIFGNHDDEGALSRAAQMELIETLPYSISEAGPEEVDGVGNYYIEVLARGNSKHSAITIYLLDTHAYSPDERSFKGYDWLKKNQIDWFKSTAQGLKKAHAEYTHVHMDLAFIHIPLPEYRNPGEFVGAFREGVTAPGFNSGFRDALVEEGVLMVSCGHDHANEYCALSKNEKGDPALWMCYAGGAGFGGYGGYGGYHRRVRFFDIDLNEARIKTYKRVEYGDIEKRIDEQVIVDGGKVMPLPEGQGSV
ncbi:hypothetical protein B7463_g11037, partial [Scytalidium lignicola]